jgi:myo-inositol 2-dehydrogenase / D-chiro-inositol 1-dehydrogenase
VKQSGVVLKYTAAARDAGLGVVYITRNPHHAYLVGNHFIILKLGQSVLDRKRSEVALDELPRQMAGGDELAELSHKLRPADASMGETMSNPTLDSDLRVGVLGAGMMGVFHAKALSSRVRGARVSVVNDVFAEKAQVLAADVGARVVDDPIAAINDPEVDAVLIATPGASHESQVNACLDARKPVLCEKPLTTEVSSAYAIVQKEAGMGQQLIQVGFMRRFDTEYLALKDLIDSGGLGNPLMVHCAHRNPAVPDFFDSEYMVRDSVVHEVDVVRFLLDEELTSVQVLRGVATSSAPPGTSDPMLVVFETESGRLVTDEIYVRTGVGYEVRTEVVGEQGSAIIGLDQHLQAKTTDGRWGGHITPSFVERFGAAYDTELLCWVDAARRGAVDGPGAWDGYAAVAVCEAGVEALRTGQKVAVAMQPRPTVSLTAGISAPDLEGARR